MKLDPNYTLHTPAWIVVLVLILASAVGFLIYDHNQDSTQTFRQELERIKSERDDIAIDLKQCQSARKTDSVKNSINHTPNIPDDEYMKPYKTVKK